VTWSLLAIGINGAKINLSLLANFKSAVFTHFFNDSMRQD